MKPPLIVSRQMPADVQTRIAAQYETPHPGDCDLDEDTTIRLLEQTGAEALLFSSHLKFPAEMIARLPPRVRIAATASVGFDHIDVPAARARGLIVTNTPDVLTDATADLTFLLILVACRRAHEYDSIMRGGWRRGFGLGEMLGKQVAGSTLGVVGYGRIGQAVGRRAAGFGMRVLYNSPRALPPDRAGGASHVPELDAMLPRCDIVSLSAPGGPATANLMDARRFALMKPGSVFVNASRGTLVDEDALLAALQSGHLFAAGLDVFRNEPAFDLRFASLPNVFLAPHMGSATVTARNAMGGRALDNIDAVLAGRPPIDPLWT